VYSQDVVGLEDEAGRGFRRARRAAFFPCLGNGMRRRIFGTAPRCESLRCFEEELAGWGLEREDRGFETVEVRRIVGSVERSGAFDAWFFPACSCTADRWRSVYGALLEGKTLPPVELYKLGGAYFVVDGNHRVSVARWRGVAAVDAVVTEFV
jgi:hypothetical protein